MEGEEGQVPIKRNTRNRKYNHESRQRTMPNKRKGLNNKKINHNRRVSGGGGMGEKREQEKKEIGGKESINEEEMIMESGT